MFSVRISFVEPMPSDDRVNAIPSPARIVELEEAIEMALYNIYMKDDGCKRRDWKALAKSLSKAGGI